MTTTESAVRYQGGTAVVDLPAQIDSTAEHAINASGLSDHYKEIFEITRLADFMTIYADEKTALGGAK